MGARQNSLLATTQHVYMVTYFLKDLRFVARIYRMEKVK